MRTRKEALEHILKSYKDCKLGGQIDFGCVYRDWSDNNCVVGCLFNNAQLNDIEGRNLMASKIGVVAKEIGRDNIEAVTGCNLTELMQMQRMHDAAAKSIRMGYVDTQLYRYVTSELALL